MSRGTDHRITEPMDGSVEDMETTSPAGGLTFAVVPLAAAAFVAVIVGAGVWTLSPDGPIGRLPLPPPSASSIETSSPSPIPTAPSPSLDRLTSAGSVEREIRIGLTFPLRAYGHGSLWVYAWLTADLVRYDPDTGVEQARIHLGPSGGRTLDHRDGAPTATAEWVFVGTPDDRIVRIDPTTNEIVDFASGVRPLWMTIDGDDLWAVDFQNDAVLRYDLDSGDALARIPVSGGPMHLALDGDIAWVPTHIGRQLVRIDTTTNAVVDAYPIAHGATRAAVLGTSVYVSGDFRPLERFSITEERVVRHGARLESVIAHEGRLVGLDRSGSLAIVDAETLEWTAVLEIGPFDRAVMVVDGERAFLDTTILRRVVRIVRLAD